MRSKKMIVVLIVTVALVAAGAFGTALACDKSAAKAAQAKADGAADAKPCCDKPCGAEKAAAMTASTHHKYDCPEKAAQAALTAAKQAAEASGCPKAKAAVEEAVLAMKAADGSVGCAKSKAAAHEAALVAIKKAAEASGSSEAQEAAAEAIELASNVTPTEEPAQQ